MGQHVERFAQLLPNAHVIFEYLHPDLVYERVHDGTADFGLVSFPRKSRELIALPWRDEEMVLTCHPGHSLSQNLAVTPAMLEGLRFVSFALRLVIRRHIDRLL